MLAHRVILLVVACCAASCSQKQAGINGIGEWVLLETELRQAPGFCNPEQDITFCSANGTVPLGGQPAEVGLYFRGGELDSKLIEIELAVRRCDAGALRTVLTHELGTPNSQKSNHYFWASKSSFIAGTIPDADGRRCLVSFVAPDDTKRIADLTAEAEAEPTAKSSP